MLCFDVIVLCLVMFLSVVGVGVKCRLRLLCCVVNLYIVCIVMM